MAQALIVGRESAARFAGAHVMKVGSGEFVIAHDDGRPLVDAPPLCSYYLASSLLSQLRRPARAMSNEDLVILAATVASEPSEAECRLTVGRTDWSLGHAEIMSLLRDALAFRALPADGAL